MAQKTTVQIIDDLTGEEGDETVRFALDGAQYEIDLSEKNATKLREAMAPFIIGARRTGTGGPTRASRRPAIRPDLDQVRAWARVNGWPDISTRGRVAGTVLDAYDNAHAA